MKALTLWQPWASLIVVGAKPYEFRGWKPPRSIIWQRIAIHAGARAVRLNEVADLINRIEVGDPSDTPCLHPEPALALLRRVLAGLEKPRERSLFDDGCAPAPFQLPLSSILATAVLGEPKRGDLCAREFGRGANDSDREGTFNWGWPMLNVEPVVPPVSARGAQGFWDFNGRLAT